MGSTKVRGITIELNADTSGITKGLKAVNAEIGSTQRQLKDVERLLKLDPTNTQLLEQKQRLLGNAITETKTKLDTLKKAQEDVGKTLKDTGEGQAQYDALTREIISCEKELKNLENQARKSNVTLQQVSAFGSKLKDAGKNISAVGDSMTRNVTMPVVAAGTAITKVAGDFEQQMAKVSSISQAYGSELDALKDKAMELSSSTQFSANEIAQAYEYMGMAGWNTEQILSGIPGVIDLATASGEDLASVSDIVTDGLTAFGLKAEDTTRFVNVLAEAARSSNTNVAMMGESFKYVGPVAGSMGYSIEDTAVALGLMANSGIKASMAGTSLRNMLQRMAKPTKESGEAMDRLGLSLSDESGRMYSLREIMDQLRSSYTQINMPLEDYNRSLDELDALLEEGTITQTNYDKELEELNQQAFGAEGAEKARAAAMLGGTRAMSGLMAIASATEEDYNSLTQAIENSSETMVRTTDGAVMPLTQAMAEGKEIAEEYSGTAAAMAGVMNDTTNVQMKQMTNELQNMAISLGKTLLPIIKDVVSMISEWAKKFQELDPETQKMIVKIALVAAAIGPLLSVGGRLISGIGTLLQLAPQIGAAASWLIANPIALIIAAVVALVALIAVKGDEIQGLLQKLDDWLQNVFATDFTKVFGPVIGEYLNAFVANISNMWNAIKLILDGLIDFIRGVFTGDWERAWRGVVEIFEGIFDGLEAMAKVPLNGVIGLLNMAINGINDLIEGFNSIGFEMPDWLGGGSWYPDLPTIGHIPYLAKGGILSQGSAIVGEAGAELLTMSGGRAIVQPLTNNTNNYAGATNNFYIQSTDPEQVAEEVSTILNNQYQRIQGAWA